MGGLLVYLVGWKNIKSLILGDSDERFKEEAARRRKLEKNSIYRHENLQDSQGTINNRIIEMEKDLERMKVVISVEKDTISLDAKNKEKMKIPQYVKQINKRMQNLDPNLKLFKAEEKIKNKNVSLREHYENWHGKVGGDPSVRYDEVDWNSMSASELQAYLDLEGLKGIPGLEGVEFDDNYM